MIDWLHHKGQTREIRENLQRRGFKILCTVNMSNMQPIILFLLLYRNGEDINEICGMNDISRIIGLEIHLIINSKFVPQFKGRQV